MLFVGHTRFSVFQYSSSQFGAVNGKFSTEESYRNFIYNPARLREKVSVFIEQSLPQINIAARRHTVVHVVSYSSSLPAEAKGRLREAASRYPLLRLNELEVGQWTEVPPPEHVVKEVLQSFGWAGRAFAVYRLDDDDLLGRQYFDRAERYITEQNLGYKISFGQGYTALRLSGQYFNTRRIFRPMLSAGMLSVAMMDEQGNISGRSFNAHSRSDRFSPVIVDSTFPAYVWGRDQWQNTSIARSRREDTTLLRMLFADLRTHEPAHVEEVGADFPEVRHAFSSEPAPHLLASSTSSPEGVRGVTSAKLATSAVVFRLGQVSSGARPIIQLDLRDAGGKLDRGDSPRKTELEAGGVKWSNTHGWHARPMSGEVGENMHVVIDLPLDIEVSGYKLLTSSDKDMIEASVTLYAFEAG